MSENYRLQGFRLLPPVVKNLLIINVILYFANEYLRLFSLRHFGIDCMSYLELHYVFSKDFFPTQYFTYLFMHAGFEHLFFNMFALWMFGYALENYWGSKRFLFYYLFCGVGAGIIQNLVVAGELLSYTQNWDLFMEFGRQVYRPTVGASGAVFGILLAFGMMFPNMLIYLYFLVPIKAKWFVIIYGVIELFAGIRGGDNVAHFAHLGGMLFGFFLILWWRKRYRRNDFY